MNSTVKRNVMTRVRTVHALRNVFSAPVLSVTIFVLALWGIGREVWVARVLQNEPPIININAVLHFYLSAFMDTRFVVQVLSMIALSALLYFGYSLIQIKKTSQTSLRFAAL